MASCTIVTHTFCDVPGPQYEILHYLENWGPVPVQGTGALIRCTVDDPLHRTKGRRTTLCRPAERDEFLRRAFPYQWQYEEEQRAAALDSAAL